MRSKLLDGTGQKTFVLVLDKGDEGAGLLLRALEGAYDHGVQLRVELPDAADIEVVRSIDVILPARRLATSSGGGEGFLGLD